MVYLLRGVRSMERDRAGIGKEDWKILCKECGGKTQIARGEASRVLGRSRLRV